MFPTITFFRTVDGKNPAPLFIPRHPPLPPRIILKMFLVSLSDLVFVFCCFVKLGKFSRQYYARGGKGAMKTGAGFFPSTVCGKMNMTEIYVAKCRTVRPPHDRLTTAPRPPHDRLTTTSIKYHIFVSHYEKGNT